jgi:hypothetical protein
MLGDCDATMRGNISRRAVIGAVATPYVLRSLDVFAEPIPLSDGFVSVRKFGAVGDGTSDDTDALMHAHASGNPLFYPKSYAFYRTSHVLTVRAPISSNGAEVRTVGNGSYQKTIFQVVANNRPIKISGFVLDGGYKEGTQGEWSHGIALTGANNVTVTKNIIQNTYGDCVYVGSGNARIASNNILIQGNKLLHPRRCNVAVVCGDGVTIEGNVCAKELDYVSGIDLEPDVNQFDYVRRVRILNNQFDSKGRFITAGVNNGIENTDLLVSGNRGRALEYFQAYRNALLRNATIARNIFSATSATGVMLKLENVHGFVSDNVDATACGGGYHSLDLYNCKLSLERNKFCGSDR